MSTKTPSQYLETILMQRRAERLAARDNDKLHPVPPRCIQCSRRLPRYRHRVQNPKKQWGAYGDGFFCTGNCARFFAVTAARAILDKR